MWCSGSVTGSGIGAVAKVVSFAQARADAGGGNVAHPLREAVIGN